MTNDGGQITVTLKLDDKQFNAAATQADATAKSLSTSFDSRLSKSLTSMSSGFDSAANAIGGFLKVSGAILIGGALGAGVFLKEAGEVQSLRASFESMTGSAENAASVLSQLNKFSFETAFSSIAINKAAQLLLGAGLEVNKLGTYMKAIGDVAGATGADLGQLTLPLSQALARGKLQTQDFYQILNSGAGKLGQLLREEVAKKGLGNLQDALADGTVTAEILFATIEKAAAQGGFAFEGAIKQAQTWTGRLSNLRETLSIVAFEVLGIDRASGNIQADGLFAKLSTAVKDATDWLTKNKVEFARIAKIIIDNAIPAFAGLATAFLVLKANIAVIGIANFVIGFIQFAKALKAGTTAMAALNAVSAVNPFIAIGYAIALLVAGLVYLQIRFNIFGKTFEWLKRVMQPVVDMFNKYLLPPLKQIANFVGGQLKKAWQDLGNAFKRIMVQIQPMLPMLKKLGIILGVVLLTPLLLSIAALATAVGIIVGVIVVISRLVGWVAQFAAVLAENVKPTLIAIGNVFKTIWEGILNVFTTVVNAIMAVWNGVLKPVFNFIGAILGVILNVFIKVFAFIALVVIGTFFIIFDAIKSVMTAIWNFIKPGVMFIWNIFKTAFDLILGVVVWYFTTIYETIKFVLTTIWNFVSYVWNIIYGTISGVAKSIWNVISSAFTGAYNSTKDTLGKLVSFVGGIGSTILGALGNFGGLLYNKGKDLINGLLNGAGSVLTNIGKFFLDKVPSYIREPFKKALGIASPSKVFAGYGKNIVQGLSRGIGRNTSLAVSAANKMAEDVSSIGMGLGSVALGADSFDGLDVESKRPVSVSISVNNSGIVARSRQEWRDINKDGIEAINEELRAKQLPEIGGGLLTKGSSTL